MKGNRFYDEVHGHWSDSAAHVDACAHRAPDDGPDLVRGERRIYFGALVLSALVAFLSLGGSFILVGFGITSPWAMCLWLIPIMRGAWGLSEDVRKWAYLRGIRKAYADEAK